MEKFEIKPVDKRSLRDLMGRNIVVFDAEIKNEIDQKNIGWKDFDKMGISVACAFDYRSYEFGVYLDDNMGTLTDRLNEPGTLVVAFNQKGFDNPLLRKDSLLVASGKVLKPDTDLIQYDMLEESRKGSGGGNFAKGHKLDDHLNAMGLPMKTDCGSQAPVMWQKGQYGQCITYCLGDVAREKMLFDRVYLGGGFMKNAYKPNGFYAKDPAAVIQ
ncbi:putative exonuclease [Bdellovibrio phage phi1422]|uniref:putative exonuclease n=1 Tax=Bdellovibrio phage phi1422 TaxID=1127515 RepID=UPI0002536D05|nr:putative exonuclease [Bdellovibrio phage phi1422]AFC22526.1 putative exonuclease [Bdellovibrio phage phi1422]